MCVCTCVCACVICLCMSYRISNGKLCCAIFRCVTRPGWHLFLHEPLRCDRRPDGLLSLGPFVKCPSRAGKKGAATRAINDHKWGSVQKVVTFK